MKGEIEKFSNVLQKNAIFNRTQKVNSLPSYLCINFVRFYWKQESAVGGTKAGRAKILRSVMYPRVLDLYQFCSDSLKVKLDAGRELEQTQRAADDAKTRAEADTVMSQRGLNEVESEESQLQRDSEDHPPVTAGVRIRASDTGTNFMRQILGSSPVVLNLALTLVLDITRPPYNSPYVDPNPRLLARLLPWAAFPGFMPDCDRMRKRNQNLSSSPNSNTNPYINHIPTRTPALTPSPCPA